MRQKSAALLVVFAAVFGAAVAHAQVTLDLTGYDCRRVGDATGVLRSRHIGQVIAGTYTEWREYLTEDAAPRLVCIEHIRPEARQLSAAAAGAFLQASAAIGAPNPERGQSLDTPPPAAGDDQFLNAKPMPLPKAVDPAPGLEHSRSFNPNGFAPASRRMDAAPSTGTAAPPLPQSNAPAVERQQTVGVDDRMRVSTTASTSFPYNTVGYLVVTYPNSAAYRCSGVLVSAYTVLTVGHCVHDRTAGGFIDQVSFRPGQNEVTFGSQTLRPFGTKTDAAFVRTTDDWMAISGGDSHSTFDYRYDIGAIEFATPFTHTSTFMPVEFDDTTTAGYSAGYPATVQGFSSLGMWQVSGAETNSSRFSLRSFGVRAFAMDATGGQSGSPFYAIDPITGTPRLTGALSFGDDLDDLAGGPWYGGANESLVTSWITWTPTSTMTANSVTGLRVPTVFDSTQSTGISFLRFFNTGSTAGTVDVTLASYDDGTLRATWTSPSIPPNASRQFDIATIENEATGGTIIRRGFHTLSIRSGFSGYFQHVLWRPGDGTITNITACDRRVTSDPTKLMNVHSSRLATGYPATISVHNTGANAVNVTLGIYDAVTGAQLRTYNTGSIPANGEVMLTTSQLEFLTGLTPSSTQLQYNIKAETSFTGTMQYLVMNSQVGTVTDMTSFCALTAGQ